MLIPLPLFPYCFIYFFWLLKRWHYSSQCLSGMIIVTGFTGGFESVEFCLNLFLCERVIMLDEDEAVVSLVKVLGLDQKFLVEFLTGSESYLLNFYVLGTHQTNHTFCKIQNLHGLSHVKHEQLSVVGHGSGGKDKLAGLRYGHEVSDNPLIRNGDRTSLCYLLSEERDYGASASQYVAESGGAAFDYSLCTHALGKHLAHSLGSSHDVGGVDRLVRGNHHEALCIVFLAAVQHVLAAENVVLYGFYAVVFHQRHMFVGSCVDYDLRSVLFEYSVECFHVCD